MPTPYEILIQARDNASATIKGVDSALKQLDSTAQKSGQSFAQAGSRSENYGRAISRGVYIAQSSLDILAPVIGKISPELDRATRAAQQFGGALSLAFSFGGPGVLVAGVATAIGLVVTWLQQQHAALAANIAISDEYIVRMHGITEALHEQGQAAEQDVKFLTDHLNKIADAEARLAEMPLPGRGGGRAATALVAQNEAYRDQARAIEQAKAAQDALTWSLASGYEEVERNRSSVGKYGDTAETAAAQIKQMADAQAAFNAMLQQQAIEGAKPYATQIQTEMRALENLPKTPGEIAAVEYRKAGEKWIADNKRAAEEWAARVKANAEAIVNTIKQMIGTALTPTAVTGADVAATKAGKYVDKWDEVRRRWESIQAKGFTGEFPKEEAELKALGMTAEQAAASFKDFSLFADPKNLNLVDWGPITLDVSHQIDMLIGKANVAKEAFDQVWSALSPQKKAALGSALGLDAADAKNADKVFETMSGGDAQASVKTTDEIAKNIQIIAGIHTAIVDVQKSATFDATLKEILDDLAKIPASADVVVTLTYETAAAPTGGETGPTPAPGAETQGIHAQHGAYFTVPPGFDENYPIFASSGEQVTVLPANMSDKDLDYFIKQNFSTLERLYNANPSYWMGVAAQHPGWDRRDWYEFIFGGQFGGFRLSDLGIPPAAGGRGAAAKPGDSYHGPVYNAPVANYFNVYPRDYEDLMRQARASAAHGA